MLYVTTRNDQNVYTAHRVLQENRAEDGGFYIPFHAPSFSEADIAALRDKSFNQSIADVLNIIFGTALTSWDIDFCVGRYPVRLKKMGHRIAISESWHNPGWNFQRMVDNLTAILSGEQTIPTEWVKIAVRIAVLFGVFGELQRDGIKSVDISAVSGDFSVPISAWYARKWGLPIGNIICCCNENNNLWDLFCHGHMRTDSLCVSTIVQEADITLPSHLERLISESGGIEEVNRYLDCSRSGYPYVPDERVLHELRQGIYVSVVSSKRIEEIIPNVYRSHGYIMEPSAALAYAGLMDYRSKTGVTRHAIVMSEKSPVLDTKIISNLLGVSEDELRQLI